MSVRKRDAILADFERWGHGQRHRPWHIRTARMYARRIVAADNWLRDHRQVSVVWAKPKDLMAYMLDGVGSPSPGYRNNIRAALIGFGEYLVEKDFCEVNSALALNRLPIPESLPKPFEPAEARAMLAAARVKGGMTEVIAVTLFHSGLRNNECRNLEWPWLSSDFSVLRLPAASQKVKRDVNIPLHSVVSRTLYKWRGQNKNPRWVFPSPHHQGNRPISPSGIYYCIRDLGEAVGVKDAYPHRCRHTFATETLERTGNLRATQELMRHVNVANTQKYTRVSPGKLRDVLEELDYGNNVETGG